VDTCLSCEDTARQSRVMVRRWRILGDFLRPVFQRAACRMFQTYLQRMRLGDEKKKERRR